MKKLMVLAVLATGSASALAVDRVVRFDLNADGKVSSEELAQSCDFRKSLFEIADKNDDGFLSNNELRNSKSYLLSNCKK